VTFAVTLASSSAGNATLFSNGRTHILLDAGLGIRTLKRNLAAFSLAPEDLSGIVISHAHGDHTRSLPYISESVPVYASSGTSKRLSNRPIAVMPGQIFEINDVQVSLFATPHDCAESTGFLLQDGEKTMVQVTDLGHMSSDVLDVLTSAPTVFLESNYDHDMLINGHYPWFLKKRIAGYHGHLSNDDCADAVAHCVKKGLQNLVLMHLSKENNTPERAYQTTTARLAHDGIVVGRDVQVQVAPRTECCELVTLC